MKTILSSPRVTSAGGRSLLSSQFVRVPHCMVLGKRAYQYPVVFDSLEMSVNQTVNGSRSSSIASCWTPLGGRFET